MVENNLHDGYLKDLPLWADEKTQAFFHRSTGVVVHG